MLLASPLHFSQRSIVRSVRLLQMVSQVHINGNCDAHYDQCAPPQYQEPPDHPHSRLG